MYSKTQGHHCWWLNKDGKAIANFDSESDVDAIITLEETHAIVVDNHVFVDCVEFKELATFVMCNDNPNQEADMEVVHSVLDQVAVRCLGFDDWMQAYHSID
jgi:hypothetical protein